jgi:hypothetical protein
MNLHRNESLIDAFPQPQVPLQDRTALAGWALSHNQNPATPAVAVERVMTEDVFATWIATGLIFAVLGTQFSSRSTIDENIRLVADSITLVIAVYIMIWASLGYFNVITLKTHQNMLISIVVVMICLLVAFLILTILQQLG